MGPLVIGGMIAGGIAGILSNEDRIEEQRRQKRIIDLQNKNLKRKLYATSAILSGEMTIGAMQATRESKQSAIEAYRAGSESEANLGKSGIKGGTPYYMVEKSILENKAALLEQADIVNKKFGLETMQGAMTINDIRDAMAINKEQQDQINERLGYLSSPFSFMVSAATGVFSGASIGANIQEFGVKVSGNAQWGEWPIKSSTTETTEAMPITSFSTIPQVAPAFDTSAPLQFGGSNISNTAKIMSPMVPSIGSFNLDLGSYESPFQLSGSRSGLRFNGF